MHRQVGEVVGSHVTGLPAGDSVCGMERGFVHTAQGMFSHESHGELHGQDSPARTTGPCPCCQPGSHSRLDTLK